jgi:DNA-binding transcriptional LysR family regulator
VLPKYVEDFRKQHPAIEMKLHNVTGEEGLRHLRAGLVDFSVGPLLKIPEDIEFHPIVSYDPFLITAPDHPLARMEHLTLREISKYPFIVPPRHLSTWRTVDHVLNEAGLPFEVAMEVGGWEVIKKYVELGLGISVIMSVCLTGDENLAIIPGGEWFPKRTYGVILRKGKLLSPQAKRFLKLLVPNEEF